MNSIKNTVLQNWHTMRWIRLALSLIILYQAIVSHDIVFGLFGAFFLFQALSNTGCCAVNNCSVPANQNLDEKEVQFEEIKK